MEAKYNLTLEENIFLAKKNIVGSIYNSAKIEGCNVTFPQTQTILNGVTPGGIDVDDVYCILNLRDAWKFVLNNVEHKMDLDFLKKINSYVSKNESLEWGVLRNGKVGISGVDYVPDIPDEIKVLEQFQEFELIDSPTKRAIEFMLWGMREQLFWDGNKRTMTIAANHILIQNGAGILTVEEKNQDRFAELLKEYYETNSMEAIEGFLYDNCVQGIEFKKDRKISKGMKR